MLLVSSSIPQSGNGVERTNTFLCQAFPLSLGPLLYSQGSVSQTWVGIRVIGIACKTEDKAPKPVLGGIQEFPKFPSDVADVVLETTIWESLCLKNKKLQTAI